MKRYFSRILALVVAACAVAGIAAGCNRGEQAEHKVGITVQSLKNAYWAGVMDKVSNLLDEEGWDYTLVDCENNAGTQVGQIENFIAAGCDLIMVHAADPVSIERICKEARELGIQVMCWDDVIENSDANWILDNEVLGEQIGKAAGTFINENYTPDNKAEVTVIGYPSVRALLDRANGIKKGLEETAAGNYEIVAETDGLEPNEAQSNVESVLSAHPDASVFVGIGSGACIGANEALIQTFGKGQIPEDVGVITTDITVQQLDSLKSNDEAVRAIIGFEGSNEDTAEAVLEMFRRIYAGEFDAANKNVIRPTMEITKDNVDEILAGM